MERLTESELEILIKKFNQKIISEQDFPDATHRYASFDFCYTYFNSFENKKELANNQNLEQSCLHLAFYLASWGMLRGSSFLLQNSLRFYIALVKTISDIPKEVWEIDVDNYNPENIKRLIETYEIFSSLYHDKRGLTLTTKIMLGVFGNVPAFDDFFCGALRAKYPGNGFRTFNENSLKKIGEFYNEFSTTINKYHDSIFCKNFFDAKVNKLNYPKAKIIDMIGFQYGFDNSKRNETKTNNQN